MQTMLIRTSSPVGAWLQFSNRDHLENALEQLCNAPMSLISQPLNFGVLEGSSEFPGGPIRPPGSVPDAG